jgi:hypothetical protein
MGCLLNPLIILLAVIGLVAAVFLLGLAAVTSSLAALSSSLTVLSSQCVLGMLALGGFAATGILLALRQPIVQTLLLARLNVPNAPLLAQSSPQASRPAPASPQVLLPPLAFDYPVLPEFTAADFHEPATVVRQPVTRAHSRRSARTIDAGTLKDWGY